MLDSVLLILRPLLNNTVILPQQKVLARCTFKCIDVLLANFADDILDICRTALELRKIFEFSIESINILVFDFMRVRLNSWYSITTQIAENVQ